MLQKNLKTYQVILSQLFLEDEVVERSDGCHVQDCRLRDCHRTEEGVTFKTLRRFVDGIVDTDF